MTTLVRDGGVDSESLRESFNRIGAEVTGPAADEVDREARFPAETIEALRAEGLLSLPIATELGGASCPTSDIAHGVNLLSRRCSSIGLILAMHYSQLVILARHGRSAELQSFQRRAAEEQWLFANCNSEVTVPGDARISRCFVEHLPGHRYQLAKDTPVMSYGEYADAALITARRAEEASETDQVLVACHRDDYQLTPTSSWDMLGLRGTCSRSFHLEAGGDDRLVLDDPYHSIVNRTGIGATNVLFAAFWLGVAEAAAISAHASVRANRSPDISTEFLALRLAELVTVLATVRDRTWSTVDRWQTVEGTAQAEDLSMIFDLQGLKAITPDAAVDIASRAVRISGIKSYLEGSRWSLGRVLRDAHGLALMASTESALQQNAQMLRVLKSI